MLRNSLFWLLLVMVTALTKEPDTVYVSKPLMLPIITSTSDIRCSANAMYGEARGESLSGKRAVIDVIEERMMSRDMTACEVVSEPGQFAGYDKSRKVTKQMLTSFIVASNMTPVVERAEYFHSTSVSPNWKHVTKLATVNHSIFYRRNK